MKWKGTWGMIRGVPRKFSVGPGIGEVEGCMVEKKPIDPSSAMCSMFLLEILNGTQVGDLEELWLETGRVISLGHQMEVWSGGKKGVSLGSSDGSRMR